MNRWMASMAATLLLFASGAVRADDKSDITSLYKKLETALRTQAYDATLGLETPDFISIDASGKKTTGKQMAAQMKAQNLGVTTVKAMTVKVQSIAVTGKTAKATTSFSWAGLVNDKKGDMGPKGKSHTMLMKGSVQNDLAKTSAGWKFKTMQMHPTSMTMDGKPFNVGAPPPHAASSK